MRNLFIALLVVIVGLVYLKRDADDNNLSAPPEKVIAFTEDTSSDVLLEQAFVSLDHEVNPNVDIDTYSGLEKIAFAYQNQLSNIQVLGSGKVIKMLPDDNRGSRHQRFILKLGNNQSLLIAHNINIADRVKSLRKGDDIEFYGVYEWNDKGGVVHWTHHDPDGSHPDGYLRYAGLKYQ
ncbi:DUF3465 domain-containing protein [Thalassotalea sp. ND16A]|uniref:DUF3465 domain-containing protein n=1 Tax=Thalassotalea sp. ND16A TaxID=1535422 RepID=UPI00051A3B36|nr:DUF3465 domain-containing protein [Thalassotalea sp. ND16A]KGK01158.1 hypothetical protein ND16A_3020 [Thalassotalea sp. ND16A]